MKQDDAREVLRLFNQNVERLPSFSFINERISIDGESAQALVLNLRMFMQENDPISLGKVLETYQALSVSPSLAREFAEICRDLNSFLDSSTSFSMDKGSLSHRDLLNMFVYGSLMYTDENLHGTFMSLRGSPFFGIAQYYMILGIDTYVASLRKLSTVNAQALKELEARS